MQPLMRRADSGVGLTLVSLGENRCHNIRFWVGFAGLGLVWAWSGPAERSSASGSYQCAKGSRRTGTRR